MCIEHNFHQMLNLDSCDQQFSQSCSYLCPQMTKLWSLQVILTDIPDKDFEPASGYVLTIGAFFLKVFSDLPKFVCFALYTYWEMSNQAKTPLLHVNSVSVPVLSSGTWDLQPDLLT